MNKKYINLTGGEIQDPEGLENMELLYEHKHGKIFDDKENKRLFTRWRGYQNTDSIQSMGLEMVELLKEKGYDQVLNCNGHVKGFFNQMDNWIMDTWVPLMIQAGLKNFAWILSPDEFSRSSAAQMVDKDEEHLLFKFNTLKEGEEWLNHIRSQKTLVNEQNSKK